MSSRDARALTEDMHRVLREVTEQGQSGVTLTADRAMLATLGVQR
jgi:hypothetical protein